MEISWQCEMGMIGTKLKEILWKCKCLGNIRMLLLKLFHLQVLFAVFTVQNFWSFLTTRNAPGLPKFPCCHHKYFSKLLCQNEITKYIAFKRNYDKYIVVYISTYLVGCLLEFDIQCVSLSDRKSGLIFCNKMIKNWS